MSNIIQADGSIHEDRLYNFLINTADEKVDLNLASNAETTSEDIYEVFVQWVRRTVHTKTGSDPVL